MINGTGKAIISRQEFEQGSAAALMRLGTLKEQGGRLDGKLDLLYKSYEATGNPEALKSFMYYARKLHTLARVAGVFFGRSKSNTELMLQADKRLKAAGGAKSYEAYKVQLSAQQAVNA